MAFRTRYRRKAPSSSEAQGLFFDKAQGTSAFFNPSRQIGERSNLAATSVVQRQEGAIAPEKQETPVQKQAKEEEPPVQKQAKEEEPPVQKQAMEEEPPVQKQAMEEETPVQKQAMEEEPPVQKQAKEEEPPVQKQDSQTDQEPVQAKGSADRPSVVSRGQQEQPTRLPDRLKAGIEALSGIAMDDVKVHYNSPKPAQMKALAYTQGTNIYLAPGQEKHLPHETWHVVQQKKGRVEPTLQTKEVGVNDDPGLEREATVMGHKASDHSSLT